MLQLIGVVGGNLGSVQRCFERLNWSYRLITSPADLTADAPIVLPGVGAFGAVMQHLHSHQLVAPLTALVQQGTPYLGICLGLQVLFEHSEENPGVAGLGLLPGTVKRFSAAGHEGMKIPQIGWNTITPASTSANANWPTGHVYFVNSFVAHPQQPAHVLYTGQYGQPFCAAVQAGHITGMQFHPEKSGDFGQTLLKHWAKGVGLDVGLDVGLAEERVT
jgi:imidazole glycerol phosphate synthase glutamine amidotransferase subunit